MRSRRCRSEGVMYPHGVENRFADWSLTRVFGSLSRFVEAAQWQQFRALKYEIETLQIGRGYVPAWRREPLCRLEPDARLRQPQPVCRSGSVAAVPGVEV